MALAVISADWIIATLTGAGLVGGLIAWIITRRDKRRSEDVTRIDQTVYAFLAQYPTRRFLIEELCGEIGHTRDEVNSSLIHLLHDDKVIKAGGRWCAKTKGARFQK